MCLHINNMTSFQERQKSLFNHLKDAEDQCSFSKSNTVQDSAQDYGVIDRKSYRKVKYEMKQFRGKESIFKRPEAKIRECLRAKSVPGYVKSPKNWVYYSLSDVTPEQMSDKTNTSTALAFIREMEEKDATNTKMETDNNSDEFVFKKPTFHMSSIVKKATNSNVAGNETVIKYNKVIMPEYVVGVTKKKEKNNRVVRRNSLNNSDEVAKKADLKLDHLYGDDEAE